jgi:hypothetical protein
MKVEKLKGIVVLSLVLCMVLMLSGCFLLKPSGENGDNGEEPPEEEGTILTWEVDSEGNIVENGLKLKTVAWDGKWQLDVKGEKHAVSTVSVAADRNPTLYFDVDDSIAYVLEPGRTAILTFEYFDEDGVEPIEKNQLIPEYISQTVKYQSAYPLAIRVGDDTWKTHQVEMTDVLFDNGYHEGTDLRISSKQEMFAVYKVTLKILD